LCRDFEFAPSYAHAVALCAISKRIKKRGETQTAFLFAFVGQSFSRKLRFKHTGHLRHVGFVDVSIVELASASILLSKRAAVPTEVGTMNSMAARLKGQAAAKLPIAAQS
jgi:hypothetical protein